MITLFSDDILSAMPESISTEGDKIPKPFTCRNSQEPPTDFKGINLLRDDATLKAPQVAYLNNLEIHAIPETVTKDDLQHKFTAEETNTLKFITSKLAKAARCI